MPLNKNAVMITAKLYETRDAFRFVFHEYYDERVAKYQKFIRAKMAELKVGPLEATLRCMEIIGERLPADDAGMAQAWFMCAVVEMIEPLPPVSPARSSEATPPAPPPRSVPNPTAR